MNPFHSFFSEIYCINRAARTDRWEKSQAEFAKLGITVTRFNAVEGGEKGCMQSHVNIIREASAKRHKRVMILEDDVEFLITDLEYYKAVFEMLTFKNWHLLYFGGNPTQKLKKENEFLLKAMGILCAHAYAVNESAFPQIIADARGNKIRVIDSYYLSRVQTKNRSFITSKFCANQRACYSDIQNYPVNYTDIKGKFERAIL